MFQFLGNKSVFLLFYSHQPCSLQASQHCNSIFHFVCPLLMRTLVLIRLWESCLQTETVLGMRSLCVCKLLKTRVLYMIRSLTTSHMSSSILFENINNWHIYSPLTRVCDISDAPLRFISYMEPTGVPNNPIISILRRNQLFLNGNCPRSEISDIGHYLIHIHISCTISVLYKTMFSS